MIAERRPRARALRRPRRHRAQATRLSNQILTGELSQLQAWPDVPLIFLGVAAFLINVVLARLVTLQRPQIATLKAVGYRNREVGAALPRAGRGRDGARRGCSASLGGWALGRVVLGLYAAFFRFPDLSFRMTASPGRRRPCWSARSRRLAGALVAVRAARQAAARRGDAPAGAARATGGARRAARARRVRRPPRDDGACARSSAGRCARCCRRSASRARWRSSSSGTSASTRSTTTSR